jgi:two-component system response regulator YesN
LLLTTEKTTAEIAELTGFTDASYFTKTFKSTYGQTPKDYRNEHKIDTL